MTIEQLTHGFLFYFIAKCTLKILIAAARLFWLAEIEQLKVESYRRNITRSLIVIEDVKKGSSKVLLRVLVLLDVVFFTAAIKVLIGVW